MIALEGDGFSAQNVLGSFPVRIAQCMAEETVSILVSATIVVENNNVHNNDRLLQAEGAYLLRDRVIQSKSELKEWSAYH